MERMSDAIDLGIRGQKAHPCDHIAYFWESNEEFAEGVGFLETGLRQQDHSVIFGHPEANRRVLQILADRGFDEGALKGRVSVLGGKPVASDMLAEIGSTFQKAVDAGARLIRLLGNIGWGHPDWPAENSIMEFEAQVTNACRNFPCVVMCMYDVRSLSGKIVVAAGIKTHPLTMCGGGLEKITTTCPQRNISPDTQSRNETQVVCGCEVLFGGCLLVADGPESHAKRSSM
jgi:hypothetical protein